MGQTQSAWTDHSANGQLVLKCTVLPVTTPTDTYTLKTPKDTIDGSRPWNLFLSFAASPDAEALPVDIWLGYEDDFVLSGTGASVVATHGAMYKQITDDCRLAVANTSAHSWLMDPNLRDADVVTIGAIASGLKVMIPPAPYYVFALDGGSALVDTLATWRIVQD